MVNATTEIEIIPLTGAMGAELKGLDVSTELSPSDFDTVHRAFLDYQVIYFRDQDVSPQALVAFAQRFGKPAIYPFIKSIEGVPEVIEILKTEEDRSNFGGGWHSDTTYLERPALGTMLYAHEVPPAGGDTLFANMYLAYDALSDGMKELLEGKIGIYSSAQKKAGGRANQMKNIVGMKDKYIETSEVHTAEHPVIRTHPETGRKALFVGRSHTVCFKNMTEEESQPLLSYLTDHAVKPEFTCRVRWEPGTLVFWDNRCTQHFAVNDYDGYRRRMHRVTLEGDRPK